MKKTEIKKNIYYVGVNDRERKMFDALFPLPNGTSYNSYLVKGDEKTVLVDTVDESKKEDFLQNLSDEKKIDYIVANHAEQDHSGCLGAILEKYPESRVLTSAYCKRMLMDLLHISEDRFVVIAEDEEFSLGGKTLRFIFTPWAHWPETFSTYSVEDKMLFSCDFFGAHTAIDSIFADDKNYYEESLKKYFAEIMMPFRDILKKNIEKVESLDLDIIAPSHGYLHKDPARAIELYKKWISPLQAGPVLLPYVSMHGSTEKMTRFLADELIAGGIDCKISNLEKDGAFFLSSDLVEAETIVLAAPTILNEAHPLALNFCDMLRLLKARFKHFAFIGSYGWGGRALENIEDSLAGLNHQMIDPVLIKGLPREEDYKELSSLADKIKKIIK